MWASCEFLNVPGVETVEELLFELVVSLGFDSLLLLILLELLLVDELLFLFELLSLFTFELFFDELLEELFSDEIPEELLSESWPSLYFCSSLLSSDEDLLSLFLSFYVDDVVFSLDFLLDELSPPEK